MEHKFSKSKLSGLIKECADFFDEIDFEKVKISFDNESDYLAYLYDKIEAARKLKSQTDYLFAFHELSLNKIVVEIDNVEFSSTDFYDLSYDFNYFIYKIESEIFQNNGNYFSVMDRIKNKKQPSKEQTTEKQTLILALKTAENILFPKNDLAISESVSRLLKHSNYSVNQLPDEVRECKYNETIYDNTIEKLNAIIQQLEKDKKKKFKK